MRDPMNPKRRIPRKCSKLGKIRNIGKIRKPVKNRRLREKSRLKKRRLALCLVAVIAFLYLVLPKQEDSKGKLNAGIGPISFARGQDQDEGMADDVSMEMLDEAIKAKPLFQFLSRQLGKPYRYGAEGPDAFDCSGLVQYAYAKMGLKLPRTAQEQATLGVPVKKRDLQFGDLVFFCRDGKNIHHVGIYLSGGFMIHAPQSGTPVKISSVDGGYYAKTFQKAVRLELPSREFPLVK